MFSILFHDDPLPGSVLLIHLARSNTPSVGDLLRGRRADDRLLDHPETEKRQNNDSEVTT